MPKLYRITGKELLAILKTHGFLVMRIKGSHHILKNIDGRSTVVPVHPGKIIGPGLLKKILKDCKLTVDLKGDYLHNHPFVK